MPVGGVSFDLDMVGRGALWSSSWICDRKVIMNRCVKILLAVGLAAVFLGGCKPGHEKKESLSGDPVRVESQKVEMTEREVSEEVVGSVRTRIRSIVEAKVSGRISQMPVVLGQKVAAGEMLAEIDAQEIQARYEQAMAQRDQAGQDLERVTALVRKQVSSRQEFDAAQARFRVAEATAREMATMLSYARVTAPFDGVISRKLADVGALAVPGKPLLEIEDRGTLRFEADVPEALIGGIFAGQKMEVVIPAIRKTFEGSVEEISPAADANSRTFLIKLDLPQSGELRAGQFGRAAIPVGRASAIRVPENAVLQRGQMELVFVVHDGRARLRIVKTGRHVGSEVEILSGLGAGEEIVVDGGGTLLDGQRVEAGK